MFVKENPDRKKKKKSPVFESPEWEDLLLLEVAAETALWYGLCTGNSVRFFCDHPLEIHVVYN